MFLPYHFNISIHTLHKIRYLFDQINCRQIYEYFLHIVYKLGLPFHEKIHLLLMNIISIDYNLYFAYEMLTTPHKKKFWSMRNFGFYESTSYWQCNYSNYYDSNLVEQRTFKRPFIKGFKYIISRIIIFNHSCHQGMNLSFV